MTDYFGLLFVVILVSPLVVFVLARAASAGYFRSKAHFLKEIGFHGKEIQ